MRTPLPSRFRKASASQVPAGINQKMGDRLHTIIFTDLDGTLLDHHTYSFDPAREALEKISTDGIPLILCTSKTRAEIEPWRKKLCNDDPFVSENGGALFFPRRSPIAATLAGLERDGYKVVELGMPYPRLTSLFASLKSAFGEKIRGFSEMDPHEVALITGLSEGDAALALMREYTEPFTFSGNDRELERLRAMVERIDLTLTRGGRFFHLLGGNDKGKAVRLVTDAYRHAFPRLRSIAIGDSANDLAMLQAVDIPVLVQKPGEFYDETAANLPNLVPAPGVGPEGWNRAVMEILGGR
jgi:mannosyl-3-phosphoglycerate phosphatase